MSKLTDKVAVVTGASKGIAVGGDVSKAAEAQGVIDAAIKKFGHLDILVNNSGVYEFLPIEAFTEEHYNKIFNVNVLGLLLATQAAVKHLGEGASIINIGSDRKSTRLNSSHQIISYAVFCLKKKNMTNTRLSTARPSSAGWRASAALLWASSRTRLRPYSKPIPIPAERVWRFPASLLRNAPT